MHADCAEIYRYDDPKEISQKCNEHIKKYINVRAATFVSQKSIPSKNFRIADRK